MLERLDAGGAIVRFCDVGLGLDSISDSESFSSSSKEESSLGLSSVGTLSGTVFIGQEVVCVRDEELDTGFCPKDITRSRILPSASVMDSPAGGDDADLSKLLLSRSATLSNASSNSDSLSFSALLPSSFVFT